MPHVALHLMLAERVLRRWDRAPLDAPFAPGPETRNAFRHGALGPDMGFFPGADATLSRLAHHARPASLTRALVAEARTHAERAFAWGWLTHVLADAAIHPLVNARCGELRHGDRARPVTSAEAEAEHVAVEMGLDAAVLAREPEIAGVRLAPAFTRPMEMRFVVRAYRAAYGASPCAGAVLDAHRRVCRVLPALSAVHRMARVAGGGVALAALRAAMPAGSGARGLFSPAAPPAWLTAAVDDVVDGFEDWFAGHYRSGARFLRELDLDTGDPIPHPDAPHPAAAALPRRPARRAA